MFGNKSFLKIGMLGDASIAGLYKNSYELESCSYGFLQGATKDGKAQTEVRGGTIDVIIHGLPTDEIIKWATSHRVYHDGVLVICDSNDMPLEKINFKDAACVEMDIDYTSSGKSYITTKLTLQARELSVGEIKLNNRWTGFNS